MKQTLLIFSDYASLSRKADRLFVETPKGEASFPLSNLDGVFVYGKAKVTSEALSLLARNCIPLIFLTQGGAFKALVIPTDGSYGYNARLTQAHLFFTQRLEIAKYLVKRKFLEIEYAFDLELEEEKLKVSRVGDYKALLGLEGATSRAMFEAFSEMIKGSPFTFTERTYNPPQDEVNALLSFLYTLGFNLALGTILIKGFDPYISFLHSKRGEHPAFASDLMEIIRPWLTLLAGELIREGRITEGDFTKTEKGFYLGKKGASLVLEAINPKKEEYVALMKEFLLELEEFRKRG